MTEKSTKSGFSAEERAAMKARAAEMKQQASKDEDRQAVLDRIASMEPHDRELATQIHELVTEAAPQLDPKTWYGMPAYARDGKIVCFFKDAGKFGGRFATFGFEDAAQLDEESIWVTSFAITKLTDADVKKLSELVKRAAG